jgi:hypothetical protein
MNRFHGRDIAFGHLIKSWDYIVDKIRSGTANTYSQEYDYHKTIFEKSLNYIEGCDAKYTKDSKGNESESQGDVE